MKKILLENPQLSQEQRIVALLTIIVPTAGACAALAYAGMHGISGAAIFVFSLMYALTTAGLTIGFHRLFTHRAFKPAHATKVAFAILGMMAAQGPLLFWVASHRRHHAYSDTKDDCHSPCMHGTDFIGQVKGLWHAHFGWMLKGEITNVPMFAKDLLQDPVLIKLNRFYLLWVCLGMVIPALMAWAITGTTSGAVEGLLWGGLFRIFFVHQITWGLNSLNHVFGSRRYACEDQSRNIGWLALVTMGEGWHNNHHAYPSSARFGHKWWELDVGYAIIQVLKSLRLCTAVNTPNFESLARKTWNTNSIKER
jgi:stearoyl-CoA desaturase (delta-9 desaturase)